MTDNEIDLGTAKYWCLFDDKTLQKVVSCMKKEAASKQAKAAEKKVIDGLKSTSKKKDIKETQLNEHGFWQFLKDFWNAPPAWAEEPTGFNDPRPEKVFKDVEAGLEGYKKGEKIGLVTGLAMVGAAEAAMAPAATSAALAKAGATAKTVGSATLKAAKPVAKVVGKTAVAAGKTALKNPGTTLVGLEIADQELNDGKATKWAWGKFKNKYAEEHPETKWLLDSAESTAKFLYANKVPLLAVAGVSYALYKTKDLWSRYMQRFAQWMTSGKCIAKAVFEADGSTWTCEFSTSSKKWQLAEGKKAAKKEDLQSFAKTEFAKKFAEECAQKWQNCTQLASSLGFNEKNLVEFLCSQSGVPGDKAELMASLLSKDSTKLMHSMRNVQI